MDVPDDIWKTAREVAEVLDWLDRAQAHPSGVIAEALMAERERCATYIEQRPGSIPDRQEIAAAIRIGNRRA